MSKLKLMGREIPRRGQVKSVWGVEPTLTRHGHKWGEMNGSEQCEVSVEKKYKRVKASGRRLDQDKPSVRRLERVKVSVGDVDRSNPV